MFNYFKTLLFSSSFFGTPVNSNFPSITIPGAVYIGYFSKISGVFVTSIISYFTFMSSSIFSTTAHPAQSGDWLQGAILMGMNGVGRVVPILLMSVLGILGVNALGGLTKKIESIRRLTGWALLILGAFIILNGAFGHLWYEGGLFHEGLNGFLMATGGKMIGEADIEIENYESEVPYYELGPWINLLVTIPPVFWYWKKYPQYRKGILQVLAIVIIWDITLFNFGLNAMEMLGLQGGLPDVMPANMTGMT